MHHPSPHQTEAEQTPDLLLANTATHLLSPRHINISNSKSRQCALPNRLSSNKHLSDHSQQDNPATHSSSNNSSSSSKCKCLWYRSNPNKLHRRKLPH